LRLLKNKEFKMGCYINPKDCIKEEWLIKNGILVSKDKMEARLLASILPEEKMLVALVNNGAFTAAGVMFNDREVEAFTEPSDTRKIFYFQVEVEKLMQITDLKDCLK